MTGLAPASRGCVAPVSEVDDLSAKEGGNRMAVERRALTHRGHVRRVYVVIALGVATMVLAFVLLVFQPLSGYLRQQYESEVSCFFDTRSLLLDRAIARDVGLAQEVASRTDIRSALAGYDNGGADLARTRTVTAPKLASALESRQSILGIGRFARDGRLIVAVGQPLPAAYARSGCNGGDAVSVAGHALLGGGGDALFYFSPILRGERLLGCDAIMMNDSELHALVSAPIGAFGNLFLVHGQDIVFAPVRPVDPRLPDALRAGLAGAVPSGYLIAFRPAPVPGWRMAAVVDEHRMFGHLDRVLDRMVVMVGAMAALIFVSLIMVLRPILRTLVAERELYDLARVDGLTGLYNHRHFQEIMDAELSRIGRHPQHALSLLILDLDHFKQVNDRYGHQAGDAVLRASADTLRGYLRGEDMAARYGGEEFAAVLPDTGPEQAQALAERVREALGAAVIAVGGENIRITVSIGVAGCLPGEQPDNKQALIKAADRALYEAKRAGRNRVVLHACGVATPVD